MNVTVKFGSMYTDEDGKHIPIRANGVSYGSLHKWRDGNGEWDVDSEIEEINNMLDFGDQFDIYGHRSLPKIKNEIRKLITVAVQAGYTPF